MVVDGIISVVCCGARGRVGKAEPERKAKREGRRVSVKASVGIIAGIMMSSVVRAVPKDMIHAMKSKISEIARICEDEEIPHTLGVGPMNGQTLNARTVPFGVVVVVWRALAAVLSGSIAGGTCLEAGSGMLRLGMV